MDGWRTDEWLIFSLMTFNSKREYGSENVFQPFISRIRALSKRIKGGYGSKNFF
jgi:hypothetical protein